jgi:hypothetical protein
MANKAIKSRVIELFPPMIWGIPNMTKSGYRVEANGHMVETDSVGNRKYNNHDFKMQGNKIIPVDSVGNRDYKRSGYVAK